MSAVNIAPQGALVHAFEKALMDDDAFDDAVNATQKTFRAVLEAMSRPGSIVALNHIPKLPSSLTTPCEDSSLRLSGLLALARTLCDADTPLWLDASLRTPALTQYLRFHCAAPLLEAHKARESAFAFITAPQEMPRLSEFNQGTLAYPDRSTTLIIACPLGSSNSALNAPSGLRASGPGIAPWQSPLALPFTGESKEHLPAWFWEDFSANHEAYPMGVDVIFVDAHASGVQIMALPRSIRVQQA